MVTFWRFGSGAPDSEPLCLRDVPALVPTYIYIPVCQFFFPFHNYHGRKKLKKRTKVLLHIFAYLFLLTLYTCSATWGQRRPSGV